jgi:succinate dehydrogenase / fumarate reductase, iron-sulfur subunit
VGEWKNNKPETTNQKPSFMEHKLLNLTLKVWKQKNTSTKGKFETYQVSGISEEMSFLEMFDVLNERLIAEGKEPVAFDHDCREGICGMCSMYIDGKAHGPWEKNTVCQLHMRAFKDGDTVVVEPWRSAAFPVIKDLVVDRGAFDRIIQAGGYVSVNTGNPVDANAIAIDKEKADDAFAAAACIGCGACVATCPNGSAMLFVSAKISQLAQLPQGHPERKVRALNMVAQMDKEGFGNCTNVYACEAECPKGISVANIARMNREYLSAGLTS